MTQNAQLSFDFIGNDSDPTPEKGHAHGTECAGVIAMSKNKYCGIGVAYDSTLVGKCVRFQFMVLYVSVHVQYNTWYSPI